MVRLPRNESKHIDWTLWLKCHHRVWPWPWLWPWIFKVKYRICYISAKNGPIATKRKANISIELQGLKCDHQVWPWPWPQPLNFQGQIWNLPYLSQKWSGCHETKSKHIDWTPRPQMWPSVLTLAMTLTLNFQGQIWNFLYLSQKWSYCHKTKSKHIHWTPGLKCDQSVWPWPQPWPLNFEGQTWPWPLTWPWIFIVKFWNSCISEWEGRLTLHKGGGSRSFMTMTMTIWWPRSGVWIYQIVTGVTSVVGVPSTHLVSFTIANFIQFVSWGYLELGDNSRKVYL